jgi:hypothetical protein
MRGWKIFTHSVGLVFRNFDAALRLSLLPYCAHIVTQIYLFSSPDLLEMPAELGGDLPQVEPAHYGIFLLLQFATVVSSLWIAVAWHRYVLKEEIAPGWVPDFRGRLLLGYFGRSVMLALLMLVAILIIGIPFSFLLETIPGATLLLVLALAVITMFLFFRVAVILPAGAIGVKLSLKEAWETTRTEQGAILAMSGVLAGFTVLFQIPMIVSEEGNTVFGLVYGLVFGWVATMVGSSVLTTLFGICVEGRSID